MRIQTILILTLSLMKFVPVLGQNITMPVRDIHYPDNIDSANCVITPSGTIWAVKIGWSSEPIVSNHTIPLVGDLNDDGVSEILCCTKDGDSHIAPYRYNNELIIYDGFTKHVKARIAVPEKITANDGAPYGLIKLPNRKGLIVVACCDYKLRAYDITSSNPDEPYWVSDVDYSMESTINGPKQHGWAVNVGFADFNSDGYPEVYVRDKIYNAETGVLLAQADGPNSGSSYGHWSHETQIKFSSPLAADVLGDEDLELILGNMIYSVEINNRNGLESNSITLVKSITPPSGVVEDGHPQVVDFNHDGILDVFISVRNSYEKNSIVNGYVWDVHNDYVSEPFSITTSFSGKSIPMISDIDNDDLIEVIIQSGVAGTNLKFQAYKYHPDTRTFSYIAGFDVDENSYSNSITAFDFNQDGLLELLICDQSTLRIVNGSGKSHITYNDTIPVYVMESFDYDEITIMQYPVIVDADDDGIAEIVSVGSNKLNFIESDGVMWAPTRKVWNQYMYNVTNVNNDLTATQYHFNNATAFIDPEGVERHPFNNFLQQVTTLDKNGEPFYASPDAYINNVSILNYEMQIEFGNDGDNALTAPYYITAFANRYGGEIITIDTISTPLAKGANAVEYISLDKNDLCGHSDLHDIVLAINCFGEGIAQNGGLQPECDTINNINSIDVSALTAMSTDTTYIHKRACGPYDWYGTTYMDTGVYYHTVSFEDKCDSILVLDLMISDVLEVDIHGLTILAVATDLWTGIYRFCIADSLGLETCDVSWECSNSDWVIIPTGEKYWCQLFVTTLGDASLIANVDCGEGCANSSSLALHAFHIGVDEIDGANVIIYPNPAKETLFVQADNLTTVRILDCAGQTVKELNYELADSVMIDVMELPRGLYFVEIGTSAGRVVKKVVLSKEL